MFVPSPQLMERCFQTLAHKSRSYVRDASDYARALIGIGMGVGLPPHDLHLLTSTDAEEIGRLRRELANTNQTLTLVQQRCTELKMEVRLCERLMGGPDPE